MTTAELTSLLLSALLADDALTARELGAVLGCTTAELRPALRRLIDAGAVTTSGRTSGTRYCLALEEEQAAVVDQASAPPAAALPARRPRHPQPPATLDLLSALVATSERLQAGQELLAISREAWSVLS